MSQWYLSKNGQALGPLEESKVVEMIQAGELSPVDLVYQTGATEWLPISEVDALSQHLQQKQEAPAPRAKGEKEWVVLKKVQTEKGKEYKQLGPYSADQIMQMIDGGEFKFTDFVWKEGMETWVKISELKEFSEPLPSSAPVDTSIYEKTNVDIDAQTLTDKEQKASLTELVNIEHFAHEKTRVQPQQRIDRTRVSRPKRKVEVEEEDDSTSSVSTDEASLFAEISEVTPIPINEESFVTESDITTGEGSESEISLWSLEPPSSKKKTEEDDDATRVASKKDLKPIPKGKKKKPKKKKKEESFKNPLGGVSTETWQWTAAIGAVIFAVIFFYKSFQVGDGEVFYNKDSALHQSANPLVDNPEAKPFKAEEIDQKMADYKQQLQQARKLKPVVKDPSPGTRLPKDVVQKIKPVPAEKLPQNQAPAPPSPKVPLKEKVQVKKKQVLVPPKKVVPPAPVVKKAPAVRVTRDREVAGKKQLLKQRADLMKKSKKKVKPRKVVPKKVTPTKKPRPTAKTSKATNVATQVATGGRKAESFYKQRDRMALFYSSLKAETLAVEIANQFKKLKSNPSAWGRYYGQWRKKVSYSLAKDIREFPKRKEKYAYPKILSSFKKDYNLFYKYGESFDARVKGTRAPSGVPSDMKNVFSRYKNQAKSLGR